MQKELTEAATLRRGCTDWALAFALLVACCRRVVVYDYEIDVASLVRALRRIERSPYIQC